MERDRENLKGDLMSAAAEFRLLVERTEDVADGGGQIAVKAWFVRVGSPIRDVNRDAARAMEIVEGLGWRVDVLMLYPRDLPCLVIREVQP